jgi:hypothetical protein
VAIINPISTEKPVKELRDTIIPNVDKLSRSTFDTLYYRRQIEPGKMRMVSQAHVEGSYLERN